MAKKGPYNWAKEVGCPICGGVNHCTFTKTKVALEPLTKDDWRRIYEFMIYVYLPFLHRVVSEARIRHVRLSDVSE